MIDYFTPKPSTSEHAFIPSRPPPAPQRDAERRTTRWPDQHRGSEAGQGNNQGVDQANDQGPDQWIGRDSDIPSYYGGGLAHSRSSQDITAAASALPDVALDPGVSVGQQVAEKEDQQKKRKRRKWMWVAVIVGILALIAVVVGVVMGVRGQGGNGGGGGKGGGRSGNESILMSSVTTISVDLPTPIITIGSPHPVTSSEPGISSLLSSTSTGSALFTITQDFGSTSVSTVIATTLATIGTTAVTTTVSATADPLSELSPRAGSATTAQVTSDTFTPLHPPTIRLRKNAGTPSGSGSR